MARLMLSIIVIICLSFTIVNGDVFMVNPFYAISSGVEYSNIKQNLNGDANHMYFQWGRLAMNNDGIIQFTNSFRNAISSFDSYIEYGYPGALNMNDYKTRYPSGKAFLSVFFENVKYSDGRKSSVEFLKMSEADWEHHIVAPMLHMMDDLSTGRNFAFDGIVLDFEGFRNMDVSEGYTVEQKANLRDKYSSFLSYLKGRLNSKLLSVCVTPSNVAGYYDGYDYTSIGHIADNVILMAYNYQHGTKYLDSELMSGYIKHTDIPQTQPYPMVESAVEELINKYSVSPNKIILGMDLAPVAWIKLRKTIDSKEYVYYIIRRTYLEDVLNINAVEQYDEASKTCSKYLDRNTALTLFYDTYKVYGEELDSVTYYYESPITIYEKYHSVLQKYGLAGTSVWRMGIGGSKIWDSLISVINMPIDVNQDSMLNIDDLVILSLSVGSTNNGVDSRWDYRADINKDEKVDQFDFKILNQHYK